MQIINALKIYCTKHLLHQSGASCQLNFWRKIEAFSVAFSSARYFWLGKKMVSLLVIGFVRDCFVKDPEAQKEFISHRIMQFTSSVTIIWELSP